MHALPRIAEVDQEAGLFTEALMSAITKQTPEAKVRVRAFLGKKSDQGRIS
jgi:hypothetical protein